MMKIFRIISELLHSNMYIIAEEEHCFIVDPCKSKEAISIIGERKVDFIFLTHEHYDHISGVNLFFDKYYAHVYAGELCAKRLDNPVLNGSHHFDAFFILYGQPCRKNITDYKCKADMIVKDRLILKWNGNTITFLYTPGHLDSCFSLMYKEFLFTGDSIMLNENGLPTGCDRRYSELYNKVTLPLLNRLSSQTVIMPGHGDCFTVSEFLKAME